MYPETQRIYLEAQRIYVEARRIYPEAQQIYSEAQEMHPEAQRNYAEAVDSPVNVGVLRLRDVRLEHPLENIERDSGRAAVPVHLLHPPLLHHGSVLLCQLFARVDIRTYSTGHLISIV